MQLSLRMKERNQVSFEEEKNETAVDVKKWLKQINDRFNSKFTHLIHI